MTETTTVLDDELARPDLASLEQASKGKRFAHFIIDYIMVFVFAIILFILLYALGIMDVDSENPIMDRVFGIVAYFGYYVVIEGATQGRSIGKFITRTRVVNLDGSTPTFGTSVKRSLSRLVPFEAFSFLGNSTGWHDRWTNTLVVNIPR